MRKHAKKGLNRNALGDLIQLEVGASIIQISKHSVGVNSIDIGSCMPSTTDSARLDSCGPSLSDFRPCRYTPPDQSAVVRRSVSAYL